LANPELGTKEITAVIQLSDLKTTLDTVALSLGLEVEFAPAGHSILLKSKSVP
jgi:ferric-dicitrate binding protein FerR (iron transport regulator)